MKHPPGFDRWSSWPRAEHDPSAGTCAPPRFDSLAVDRLQRAAMANPLAVREPGRTDLPGLIDWNHCCNRMLWDEEDQARRTDVPDSAIVQNKRAIDRYNQQRNDAIEAIDECLLASVQSVPPRADTWLNSETAGSIIDRLSINLLKLHHMGLQAQRGEASVEHRERCAAKLERLEEQRLDLLGCLQRLLDGLRDGSCSFRVYRQFKMYNDPTLNPFLRGAAAPQMH